MKGLASVYLKVAAFSVMALIWGLTWLPTKMAAEVVPPIFLAAARLSIAALWFFAVVRLKRMQLVPGDRGRVVVSSLLISTFCSAFTFWGTAHSPSGLSAIVNLALLPVFIIVVGALYGQEAITRRRVIAIGLGATGLFCLFIGRVGPAQEGYLWGLSAVAFGTLSYAWGAIVSRPLLNDMPPLVLAFWQSAIGAVGLIAISLVLEGFDTSYILGLADRRALLGLGTLTAGTVVSFAIYLWLIREWGAFRAGLYAFVSPIIAVAVGVAFGGEQFGIPEALGMAIMLSATALALTERWASLNETRPGAKG